MYYKKVEYREFDSLGTIENWEKESLGKEYESLKGSFVFNDNPTARAIIQYAGFLYKPLNYYGRISSKSLIRCDNEMYAKYILDIVEFMYSVPIHEDIVAYRFIHRKDFPKLRIAARQERGLIRGCAYLLEKGFTSTTLLPSKYLESNECAYNSENSVCLKILIPKGSFGIFVSPIAGRKQESELLLAPYTFLRPIKGKKGEILCKLSSQDRVSVVHDSSVTSYFRHAFPYVAALMD